MIQTETERQFYLGAAGIRLWYARGALPGAAASPEFEFGGDEADVVAEPWVEAAPAPSRSQPKAAPPVPGRSEADSARVANLQALMETPVSKPARPQPSSSADAAAETTTDAAPVEEAPASSAREVVPALNLQVWVGRKTAVVASVSKEASVRLQETLAENILKSVGERDLRSVGPIHWPVFNNVRAPGNSLSDLRAVLAYALSDLDGRKLIALGVTAPDDYRGDESWFQHIAGVSPEISFNHSLAELATSPALKRALWQELKPLAGQ
ncbi:2-isopropylmalate synthase [Marinobacter sediminum]|uniref:2-isopropylmalate synthase n=1 Tax=Marinobacter sediminum TaxID=256323 RepID=UPI0019394195|nr:2-isopropylmalate synthase [Marinobacter sediminum]